MRVKDWRNPDQYKYLGPATKRPQWAWEFLRRNREYQAAWQKLQAMPIYSGQPTSDDDPIDWYEAYYPTKPGETVKTFIDRLIREFRETNRDDWRQPFMSMDVVTAERFRLSNKWRDWSGCRPVIPNPLEDDPWKLEHFGFADGVVKLLSAGIKPEHEKFLGSLASGARWSERHQQHIPIHIDEREVKWRADSPEQVAVIIDLKWPIQEQLRIAEPALKHFQKEMVNARKAINGQFRIARRNAIHPGTYVAYLRLLDAELDGIALPEAASIIYPQGRDIAKENVIDRARKALRAARLLSDRDYPLLLLSGC